MSQHKWDVADWKDRYYKVDEKYNTLINAIKSGNQPVIDMLVREHDFNEKAKEGELARWIERTIK
jgi:hypothetical protein